MEIIIFYLFLFFLLSPQLATEMRNRSDKDWWRTTF